MAKEQVDEIAGKKTPRPSTPPLSNNTVESDKVEATKREVDRLVSTVNRAESVPVIESAVLELVALSRKQRNADLS